MFHIVTRGLRRITDFKGRDTRAQFWPYALTVAFVGFVGILMVMIPEAIRMVSAMQAVAIADPESVTVVTSPTSYEMRVDAEAMDFVPNSSLIFGLIGLVIATVVVLSGAAVCRRLHDRGLSGFWGLIPPLLYAIAFTGVVMVFPSWMTSGEPDIGVFMLIWLTGMLSYAALFVLVIVLALRGTRGPNRFGPNPSEI